MRDGKWRLREVALESVMFVLLVVLAGLVVVAVGIAAELVGEVLGIW